MRPKTIARWSSTKDTKESVKKCVIKVRFFAIVSRIENEDDLTFKFTDHFI